MKPGYLCSNLLHNFRVLPGCGKSPHIFQVPGREAPHIGKIKPEIGRKTVNNLSAPSFGLPPARFDLPVSFDMGNLRSHSGSVPSFRIERYWS
jgi:hypothetical protein